MSRRAAFAAMAALLAGEAGAATLRDCETFEANARNLVLPAEEGVRTFADGAIRFLLLDTGGEPACCSMHLLVSLPASEGPGDVCGLISNEGTFGYQDIALREARARYDPSVGLTVEVPATVYGDADGTGVTVVVTVDQAAGTIDVATLAP